jgi:hypothetical protein
LLRQYEFLFTPFPAARRQRHNSAMEQKKRKSFRFKAEPGTLVVFQKVSNPVKITGLAIDESYRGCSFVMVSKEPFEKGDHIKVKVGKLAALLGEVRWVKDLKDSVWTIGVEFLE